MAEQKKYLDDTGLGQVWNAATGTFVAQEEGKGLSANDFTDEMVEKVNNAANASEVATALGEKANASDMETALNAKANADTVYTKEETDQKIKVAVTGSYKAKGSINFAELPTVDMTTGDMYNIKDAFATTEAFIEGAGLSYPAGTNVVYTADGKWDCMAGTWDFSEFLMKDDVQPMTAEEIAAICTLPTATE